MFNGGNGFSLADIAAAVGGNRNNGNGGFGDGNGWWVLIVLLALWGGDGGLFGNRNNGNNGNNCCNGGSNVTYVPVPMGGYGYGGFGGAVGFSDAAMQRGFDNQTVINKLDGLTSGICSLGYDQLNRFNGISTEVMQGNFALQQAVNQGQVANMQGFNSLGAQLHDCCCDARQQISDLKYDMATSDCSIKTLMNQLFQQMMWGQQNNTRDLMDLINNKFCALEMSQKDATIAALRDQLMACGNNTQMANVSNMLNELYNRLTATLDPRPMPSYPACNPHGVGNWSPNVLSGNGYYNNGCDCNSGCGCN